MPKRAKYTGECPNCGRAILLRTDGLLRLHFNWERTYCEGKDKREPRVPRMGSVQKLTVHYRRTYGLL